MLESVLPMFSSGNFIVSGLTFRSLIHLLVIFVWCEKCSSSIILQVVDQFFQHHLLKRSSFLNCIFFASFVKDKVFIGVLIYFWGFYFVSFIYISVVMQYHTVLMTVVL